MKNENKGLGAAATASEAEDVEAGAPTQSLYPLHNHSKTPRYVTTSHCRQDAAHLLAR